MKALTDLQWVALARSKDETPGGRWELAVTSEPQLPVTSEPRS
jgi:hypothetical protein